MTSYFSKEKKAVDKATTDDEQPVSGHILEDVARLTHESMDSSRLVLECLLKRVDKPSPHVKFKSLKVIKHVLEKGHPSFRADLKNHTNKLRACSTFQAARDPLHGDTFIKRVRETAAETLNALFDTETKSAYSYSKYDHRDGDVTFRPGTSNAAAASSPSFAPGASVGGGGGGGSDGGDGKMWGFQNPNAPASPSADNRSMLGIAKQKVAEMRGQSPGTVPQKRYGGFSSSDMLESNRGSNPTTVHSYPPTTGSVATSPPVQTGPIAADSGEYERRLVDNITAPGGVRSAPPRDALQRFCQQCASLDMQVISESLEDRLQEDSWQIKLKSLYVIEALIKNDLHEVAVFFAEDSSVVEAACASPQATVKAAAHRVLRLLAPVQQDLGGTNSRVSPDPVTPATAQHAAPPLHRATLVQSTERASSMPDLFNPSGRVAQHPFAPVEPSLSTGNLFEGLTPAGGPAGGAAGAPGGSAAGGGAAGGGASLFENLASPTASNGSMLADLAAARDTPSGPPPGPSAGTATNAPAPACGAAGVSGGRFAGLTPAFSTEREEEEAAAAAVPTIAGNAGEPTDNEFSGMFAGLSGPSGWGERHEEHMPAAAVAPPPSGDTTTTPPPVSSTTSLFSGLTVGHVPPPASTATTTPSGFSFMNDTPPAAVEHHAVAPPLQTAPAAKQDLLSFALASSDTKKAAEPLDDFDPLKGLGPISSTPARTPVNVPAMTHLSGPTPPPRAVGDATQPQVMVINGVRMMVMPLPENSVNNSVPYSMPMGGTPPPGRTFAPTGAPPPPAVGSSPARAGPPSKGEALMGGPARGAPSSAPKKDSFAFISAEVARAAKRG